MFYVTADKKLVQDKTNLFLTASFWPKFEQSSDYLYEKYKQVKTRTSFYYISDIIWK